MNSKTKDMKSPQKVDEQQLDISVFLLKQIVKSHHEEVNQLIDRNKELLKILDEHTKLSIKHKKPYINLQDELRQTSYEITELIMNFEEFSNLKKGEQNNETHHHRPL